MAVDWPALTREIDILGAPVRVIDTAGDGPALVLVHGLGANWQNWLLTIPAFMASHRVVALDLPGFGGSAMPAQPIAIRGYAAVVDAVCEALGIERTVVVGSSMGGFVGAELALSFPTRVDGLVLVSAAGLSIEERRREPFLTLARAWSVATVRAVGARDAVVRRMRLRRAALALVVRHPERLSAPLTAELVQSTGKPGFIPALEAMLGYSLRERLPQITCPVLVVWGEDDRLVPVADAEGFRRLIGANARSVVFTDTGHAPMIERPSRFNAELAAFLARRPAGDAIRLGLGLSS